MDPRRFDELARSLVSPASRRQAVAALIAPLLPALASAAERKRAAGKRKDRDKSQRDDKDQKRGKDKAKAKKRKQKQRKLARAEAAPGCCSSGNCTPGSGKNLNKCCYEGQDLAGKNFQRSNLTRADFKEANLTSAKFQGSNLTGACLAGANITGANFKGANLSGVVFCRTIINSAGDEDNSGCDDGTPCCPTCDDQHPCGPGLLCCRGHCQAIECCTNAECNTGKVCCDGTCENFVWVNQTVFGSEGTGNGQFRSPHGNAVSPDGLTVWVADNGNERISIWTRPNVNSTDWSAQTPLGNGRGNGANQFAGPLGVTISPDTRTLWVADSDNRRISIWTRPNAGSTNWSPLTTFGTGQFFVTFDVAVSADLLTAWVADTQNHRISVWTRPNASSLTWTNHSNFGSGPGTGDNQFREPLGVAVSADKRTVWVADRFNDRVSIWTRSSATSTDWHFETKFGTLGGQLGQLQKPSDVAISADTLTVWVTDTENWRVSIWTRPNATSTNWSNPAAFGTRGTARDQFDLPQSVSLSADEETAWVTDERNSRISVWKLVCPVA